MNVKRRLCRSRDTGRGMEEGSRELRVREKRGMEEKKKGRKQWLGDGSQWAPVRCMLIGEQVLGLGAGG